MSSCNELFSNLINWVSDNVLKSLLIPLYLNRSNNNVLTRIE